MDGNRQISGFQRQPRQRRQLRLQGLERQQLLSGLGRQRQPARLPLSELPFQSNQNPKN